VVQVAGSLVSYGVKYELTATSDLMFPAVVLGIFNKGSPMEICSNADCDMWNDVLVFAANDAKFWVAGKADTVNSGEVIVGGYVHWGECCLPRFFAGRTSNLTSARCRTHQT
jgi:hypothetical protein